jgi:dihydroneopterin aldolase
MSDDVSLAFEHPEERSKAISGSLVDRISLRDHIVEAEIGAFQVERGVQQRMSFNVVVEVRPSSGADTDDVDDILSYDRVTEAIAAEMSVERLNLLETLAERVADRILLEPQALRVFVRIEKLDRGPGKLGVEIVRSRQDNAPKALSTDMPSPVVVYVSNAALASDHLAGWLDQLAASPDPVILSLGMAAAVPVDESGSVGLHVGLLSMEQNAWLLAERDKRCVVVGTKTELDWGMKNGQLSVWAPSKLVLDSVEAPDFDLTKAQSLAAWFAAEMQAQKVIVIGEDAAGGAMETVTLGVDDAVLPL